MKHGLLLVVILEGSAALADFLSLNMLPGEHWWGLCSGFGREMPFTEASDFSCDLRLDNYSHQSLSFLCSDRGRVVWCAEPVGVKIANGEIAIKSDKGEIVLKENAGRNLGEAFRYAGRSAMRQRHGSRRRARSRSFSTSPRRSTTRGSSLPTTRTKRTSSRTRSRCWTTDCRPACS